MSTVNRHTVFGRLGRDPQVQGDGDKAYAILEIATQEYVKGKGDKDKNGNATDYKTTWHKAVAFSDQARYIADNFSKGDMVYLEGLLEIATYTQKDNQGNVIEIAIYTQNSTGNGNGNQIVEHYKL